MDQLKDILKQAIKHRFWIAVGISALLPLIAYAAGSGRIKEAAKSKTAEIENAEKDVKQYSAGVVPNAQYKPIVDAKKEVLVKDVNVSWKKLYARQAPLLTWPELVADRFPKWERKWPEGVDPGAVQQAIVEYVEEYPKFVTQVYQIFKPFDVVEGTGVVSAPIEEALLKPFPFKIETPPELGKVWAAQERLWTQRTILEVIAQVNQGAENWDAAVIKQINVLQVGNQAAQDQMSIAKGETLVEAPAITDPATASAEAAPDPSMAVEPGMEPGMGMPGMGMGMGMGMAMANTETVFYIQNENTQFKILPFQVSLLIEQDRLQDLIIALENSPMAVQVKEFELQKPLARVTKPVKGQGMNFYAYAAGGMMPGMEGMAGMMPGMSFFGGGYMPGMGMGMMPGMEGMGMGGMPMRDRVGVDKRSVSRKAQREAADKAAKSAVAPTIHDPYYNIVEVTIYGQARFYNPPPPEPAPEPSVTEAAETPEGTPPATEAPMPAPGGEAPAPKAEGAAASTPAPAPATGGEAPKAAPDAPAPAPTPNGEAPKAAPDASTPK